MRTRPGSCADVALRCEDCESATETTLVLSPEEAKALGLHALRDLPEAPQQPLALRGATQVESKRGSTSTDPG